MVNVLHVKGNPSDHPWETIAAACREIIVTNKGDIYQKFSCHQCGQRLTMDEPNTLYTHGTCDKCGALTDIRAQGCNYILSMPSDPARLAQPRALTIKVTDPLRLGQEGNV